MHPTGEDHLLGLGRDADPNTGIVQKLQVSLFDVSDLALPILTDRFEFQLPSWAQTEATDDHHAVAYYPEHQVLALPITNGRRIQLWVFRIDLPTADDQRSAVKLLGQIEHNSQVRRSVRIADYLYSISEDSITVFPIMEPEREAARLSLREEAGDANGDGLFDHSDVDQVLQSNKYLTGAAADWSDGDWNRDGVFNQLDIVAALQTGNYRPMPARN